MRALHRYAWFRFWLAAALLPLAIACFLLARWEKQPAWFLRLTPRGDCAALCKGTTNDEGEFLRGAMELWDLKSRRRKYCLEDPSAVGSLAFSPDGKWLAIGGVNGEITLWDVETGSRLRSFAAHQSFIHKLYFVQRGDSLLSASSDGAVRIWDARTGRQVASLNVSKAYTRISLAPDQQRLYVMSDPTKSAAIQVFDVSENQFRPVSTIDSGPGRIFLSPDGETLALYGGATNQVLFFNAVSGQAKGQMLLKGFASDLTFSPDGKTLVSVGHSGKVHAWDIESGRPAMTYVGTEPSLWSVSFTRDGRQLLAAGDDGAISIWNRQAVERTGLLSSYRHFPLACAAATCAFLLWAALWVAAGARAARSYRPLFDVLLLHFLVLACFLFRFLTVDSVLNLERPSAVIVLAALSSLISQLVFWAIFGSQRWALRITGFLVGLTLGWSLLLAVWRGYSRLNVEVLLGAAVILVSQFAILLAGRLAGVRLLHATDSPDSLQRTKGRGQLSLGDALLWISALALFFAVARFATPQPISLQQFWFLVVVGLSIVATVLSSLWAALSPHRGWLRFAIVAAVVVASGAAPRLTFGAFSDPAWTWYVGLNAHLALILTASLLVFRIHGYRLALRSQEGLLPRHVPRPASTAVAGAEGATLGARQGIRSRRT